MILALPVLDELEKIENSLIDSLQALRKVDGEVTVMKNDVQASKEFWQSAVNEIQNIDLSQQFSDNASAPDHAFLTNVELGRKKQSSEKMVVDSEIAESNQKLQIQAESRDAISKDHEPNELLDDGDEKSTELKKRRSIAKMFGGDLCTLARNGDIKAIRDLEKILSTSTFKSELFSRDKFRQTPLGCALESKNKELISYFLGLGAAETIFVKGSHPETILCTLPFGRRPLPSLSPELESKFIRSISSDHPTQDMIDLLDDALEHFVQGFVQPASVRSADHGPALPPASPAAAPSAPGPPDGFKVGDRVRLRPSVTGSSVAGLKPGQNGVMYCGRNLGKHIVASSDGICGPGSAGGPQCPSCAKYSGIVVESIAASQACLSFMASEGVVKAVKTSAITLTAPPPELYRVASVHSGHLCYYPAEDLMYADGSLPGSSPIISDSLPTTMSGGAGSAGQAASNPSRLVPQDWGGALIDRVEVSTDNGRNGPTVLMDKDPATFWRSNGPSGTHYIQVTLKKPRLLKDFGIIIDESDGNYCPHRIRLFVGLSAATLRDLGTQTTVDRTTGPKKVSLLKDTKWPVGVIKVLVEDSGGGKDCKVRGVTVLQTPPTRSGLKAGDRVVLSPKYTGDAWNLSGGKVGIVVCAPLRAGGEQRCVMVSSMQQAEPQHYNCFRSSWLQSAPRLQRFCLGDLVQLDDSVDGSVGNALVESRCLGYPAQRRYGVVVGVGIERDGIQRNLEVAVEVDGLGVQKSTYPSFALQIATPLSIFPLEHRQSLASTLRGLAEQARLELQVDDLVNRMGLDTWSRLWKLLTERLGKETLASAFIGWQASRCKDLLTAALRDELAAAAEEAAASAASAYNSANSDSLDTKTAADTLTSAISSASPQEAKWWGCESCSFGENPKERLSCLVCGKRGRPWVCDCSHRNRVGDSQCYLCSKPRFEADSKEMDTERELREHVERCMRFKGLANHFPLEELLVESVKNLMLKGITDLELRTSVTEAQLKEAGLRLGVRKSIMAWLYALQTPQKLKEIYELPNDGGKLVIFFPVIVTLQAAKIDSLTAEFSKYGYVVNVRMNCDSNQAYVYFGDFAEAAQAQRGCSKYKVHIGEPAVWMGSSSKGWTEFKYNCQNCPFSNLVDDTECLLCQSKRPGWVGEVLQELIKARKSLPKPDRKSVDKGTSSESVKQIQRHPRWKSWAETADREHLRCAEIMQNRAKQEREKCSKTQGAEQQTSDSEGSGEEGDDQLELEDNAEIILNEQLKEANTAKPASAGGKDLWRKVSRLFYPLPHYEPLADPSQLLCWRDSFGSHATHHAASMHLHRSLQALYKAGAPRWATNCAGETPEALAHDLKYLSPSRATLHRSVVKGGFLRLQSSAKQDSRETAAAIVRLLKMVICTAEGYETPKELKEITVLLQAGSAGKAMELARRECEVHPHARAYMAVAMLDEGFGAKAVRRELDCYLAELMQLQADPGDPQLVVDPIFYYAHYSMWVKQGRPRGKKERLKAAYALVALRSFPRFSGEWVSETDNLDEWLQTQGVDEDKNEELLDLVVEDDIADSDEDFESPGPQDPEIQWVLAKKSHGMDSPAMDKLMALTGLREVKRSAMGVVKEVLLKRHRPAGIRTETSMNFLFVGNPGCGKTTVAKLLGAAMAELGYRKNKTVVETSAQSILKMSPDPVSAFVDMVKKAQGGSIFIDEAYRFSPNTSGGQPNASNMVLDYLLEAVEDEKIRETTTFILAGYKNEIEVLLSYNPGFASRFSCEFNFEDFSESQLRRILVTMIRARGLRFESRRECGVPLARIISRRIARFAGKKGFGNARAVRNKVEEIIKNQTDRLGLLELQGRRVQPEEYRILKREEAVGPRPDFSQSPMLRELEAMVGLSKVKEAVRNLIDLQVQNYDREMAGERPDLISLHRVFHGNPGTGKTTVVRIYGALLKELGLLSKGDLIQCTPADLTGDAEGGAAANTRVMLERARGKVLFIDEAYVLDPNRKANQYGANVLDTLVEKLEGDAGSDIAVILAGYSREMFDMLENNPGLRRRFNIDDFGVHFEDLGDADLKQVLVRMAGKDGLAFDNMEVIDHVVNLLAQKRRLPNFGNAGTVASILSLAKVNKSARLAKAGREADPQGVPATDAQQPDVLIKADFSVEEISAEKGRDAFSKLFNMDHIIKVLDELEAVILAAKTDGKDPADILADSHMVFTGPPGTGKTTVANKFGQLFKNLALLPTDNVIVTTGTALQGQYVGETKNKVLRVMQQARGGILFIDECYGLDASAGNWGYAAEAVEALVGHITEKEFKGNLLVIMSGYRDRVNRMFDRANPGFRSRFDKVRVDFPSWTAEQASEAALQAVERDCKSLTADAVKELRRCFDEMSQRSTWASARDVFETVLPALYSKRAARLLAEQRSRAASGADSTVTSFTPRRRKAAAESVADQPYEAIDVLNAFASSLSAGSSLTMLWTAGEMRGAIETARVAGQLLVVDFFAEWSEPCKRFAAGLEALRSDFPTVAYAQVDVVQSQEMAAQYYVESFPTLIAFYGGSEVHRLQGGSVSRARTFITAFTAKIKGTVDTGPGSDGANQNSSSATGFSGALRSGGQGVEQQPGEAGDMDRSSNQNSMGNQFITKKKAKHKTKKSGGNDGEEEDLACPDAEAVWAALEAACKELKYSLDKMAEMLQPGGRLEQAIIDCVMRKTNCHDEPRIRGMLESQRAKVFANVQKLIEERKRVKTEEEQKAQQKLKRMGRCPMDYEWLRVDGGWRCAGGTHFMTDGELNKS